MIRLGGVSARGLVERGRSRALLTRVDLEAGPGVLAVLGAHADGTTLLLDVIDGTVVPKEGRVVVLGREGADRQSTDLRAQIARVSRDAPLPDELRVEEVCDLSSELRGEARVRAADRLAVLGVVHLEGRRVRSLTREERRTVALALALTSTRARVVLVEEPLASLDPVALPRVIQALRERGRTACVVVTTASVRDAVALGDPLQILSSGVLSPLGRLDALDADGTVSVRVVLSTTNESAGAARLLSTLGGDPAVVRVDTTTAGSQVAEERATSFVVVGSDVRTLARAITRAVAASHVDVDLIEPRPAPLAAIQTAVRARETP